MADASRINLTNQFLIAMPGMAGGTFTGAVVYLCEHTEKGALGLVINKPIDIKLKNLFEKVELSLDREDLADEPVYFGGPVQTERGFVLHERLGAAGVPVYGPRPAMLRETVAGRALLALLRLSDGEFRRDDVGEQRARFGGATCELGLAVLAVPVEPRVPLVDAADDVGET